jgi:GrpB-like predicted nucleotidyltransferase (UPF0157 family)
VIRVVAYDPAWRDRFEVLRATYVEALADVPVVAIEHVGSTAVVGLAAKPIVDIDIVVEPEHVDAAGRAIERIGFQPLGELGIPNRWAFREPPGLPRTNTYIVEAGCLALRNHLAVRDVLRVDATLRSEYADLKRDLARRVRDMDAYVQGKTAVLSRVLERAGLTDQERASIARLTPRR